MWQMSYPEHTQNGTGLSSCERDALWTVLFTRYDGSSNNSSEITLPLPTLEIKKQATQKHPPSTSTGKKRHSDVVEHHF